MSASLKFKLNTGAEVPAIGLGCWAGMDEQDRTAATEWFLHAFKLGYRRFDTAYIYGTEKALGKAIKESGIPREEIFVVTKLPWHHAGMEEESIQRSLSNLGLDYVDLWLMHWPQVMVYEDDNGFPRDENNNLKIRDYPFEKIWEGMEKVYQSGKAKAIGVSNFSIKTLEQLLKTARVVPADNQVELHPYLSQPELVKYCQEKGIAVTAYTPTGYGTVRDDSVLGEIAKKYDVKPAQVILAWHLWRGVHVVPRSKNPEHQAENLNLPTLAQEDLERISALNKNQRLCNPIRNGMVNGWTAERLGWEY